MTDHNLPSRREVVGEGVVVGANRWLLEEEEVDWYCWQREAEGVARSCCWTLEEVGGD